MRLRLVGLPAAVLLAKPNRVNLFDCCMLLTATAAVLPWLHVEQIVEKQTVAADLVLSFQYFNLLNNRVNSAKATVQSRRFR